MLLTSSKKGVGASRYSAKRTTNAPRREGSHTIRISEKAYKHINEIGTFGETYNDVIKRILDKIEE